MPTISRGATPAYTFEPADTTAAFTYDLPPAAGIGPDSKGPTTPQGTFIVGTAGNDTLNGTSKAESIHGGGGNDIIDGKGGNDHLFGGEGNDSLTGGEGDDVVDGGAGNDTFKAGNGNDTFIGGEGSDTLDFSSSTVSHGHLHQSRRQLLGHRRHDLRNRERARDYVQRHSQWRREQQ